MADNRKLQSVIQIDGKDYEVAAKTAETAITATTAGIADTARKVENSLTIMAYDDAGDTTDFVFDGSKSFSINLRKSGGAGGAGGAADQIIVHLDGDNKTSYATISIRSVDPEASEGGIGDIWFKYSN